MWQTLFANFAVVGLFVSAWLQAQDRLRTVRRRGRRLLFGLFMGCGAIASMLLAIEFQPGVFFDLRSTFIALAGFLGGPLGAGVAAIIAIAYRVTLGGAGLAGGLVGVAVAALTGLAAQRLIGRKTPTLIQTIAFAAGSATLPLVSLAVLSPVVRDHALSGAVLPMVLVGFAATLFAALSIARSRRHVEERKLLLAALHQAPDYLYVKDRESRFVAVNEAVARVNGVTSPDQLYGKTDFDLVAPERAARLFAEEQRVMGSDGAALDVEEMVETDGVDRWFITSKSAVRNIDGEVLGLTGVTRDVTEKKRLEEAFIRSGDQLNLVLSEMSDGIALFEDTGRLAFANDQYRKLFPLTSDLRVPGAQLRDILDAAYRRGEQLSIPPAGLQPWIESVLGALKTGGVEEVHLYDGRWLYVRTKPIEAGGATVIVSDITEIKRAEAGLMALTDQLQLLARTDGLTGLLNRRSFDEELDKEVARTRRNGMPIGLIMVDIDRFKLFNDRYGHPAGDECIKKVATTLRTAARRPADLAARYGGEEMCLILPDTDDAGAFALAEQLRLAVRGLAIEHADSEKGLVTISLGVATYSANEPARSGEVLVARADEALYIAKDAGRDRVMGWSDRHTARAAHQ
ncbi:diguanylate cyclase [Devosia sp.]|uniref:diguanylate cyclase n=1 Tax=Devosia sp. TaxID=1871048 RepID=UPI003BACBF76